jgi:hypothetical protein
MAITLNIDGFTSVEKMALETGSFDMAVAFDDAKQHGFAMLDSHEFFNAMAAKRFDEGRTDLCVLWHQITSTKLALDKMIYAKLEEAIKRHTYN